MKKYGWGISILRENTLSLGCLRSGTKRIMESPVSAIYDNRKLQTRGIPRFAKYRRSQTVFPQDRATPAIFFH